MSATNNKTNKNELGTPLVGDSDPEARVARGEDEDTLCGIGPCHLPFMQHFAKVGCFTGFYSMAGLVTSTLTVYVNSQVTTLERQFGFSSKQTALIMAANDMGFLVFVLFVSYLANMVHIPRALALTTIIYGISGLICSLPHFVYGNSLNQNPDISMGNDMSDIMANRSNWQRGQEIHGQLCQYDDQPDFGACQDEGSSSQSFQSINQQAALSSLAIIVIGMMLQGMGKTPRYSFTVTYIDNNTKQVKTGFFVGVIITLSILGPALAFTMGGLFTRMYVTLEATNLTPKHPRWIGAWWLGYVVFGCIAIIVSLPLFCFPRRLPRKSQNPRLEDKPRKPIYKGKDASEVRPEKSDHAPDSRNSQNNSLQHDMKVSGQQSPVLGHKALDHFKGFTKTLLRLWTNPVYMLICFSNCFIIFTVSGASAYTPKYLERIFDLPAHRANYIMAAKTLIASCVGTFVGGYLSKRWKLNAFTSLIFTVTVVFVATVLSGLAFFFYCEQPETFNVPGSTSTCASECQCAENSYFPVCGSDGRTYYSPCSAGCQTWSSDSYQNCTCIEGGVAHTGICPYNCDQMYYYAVSTGLRSLLGTLSIVPKVTVTIRSVQERDKALAMGFSTFMTALLGWLLGPVVFGVIIDGICVIWDIKCGITGRCLLYDNNIFRLRLHGYVLMGQVGSLVCQIIALIYAKRTGCLVKKIEGVTPSPEVDGEAANDENGHARKSEEKEPHEVGSSDGLLEDCDLDGSGGGAENSNDNDQDTVAAIQEYDAAENNVTREKDDNDGGDKLNEKM